MTGVAVSGVGLVTSLGLDAESTCAALRASVTNPSISRFRGRDGQRINAHQVELDAPWVGIAKLVQMALLAADECLAGTRDALAGDAIPVLLCTAEQRRPGRLEDLDDALFDGVRAGLGVRVDDRHSAIFPLGRVAALAALERARRLVTEHGCGQVLIVAADGLLSWPALKHYVDQDRVLREDNSNGFMPGEGAGALLIAAAHADDTLRCTGIGAGVEPAPVLSGTPLRGDGLTAAIAQAMREAGLLADDVDFIVADISGEQYFFKEAALARARALRGHVRTLDLWHPAEGIGEAGALAGVAAIAAAWTAMRKGYACGPRVLVHGSDDGSYRFAAVLCRPETRNMERMS
jgi:3-oxoacyl-[acyl-carrier-protein] synthase-1